MIVLNNMKLKFIVLDMAKTPLLISAPKPVRNIKNITTNDKNSFFVSFNDNPLIIIYSTVN